MTEREIRQMKAEGIEPQKIKNGCCYIFSYLEQEGFSLKETDRLISSMKNIIDKITEKDPLRKIVEFDYFSSIEDSFPSIAASKIKS